MSAENIQKKPQDWHRADIIAELRKKGWSLRQLSIAHGLSPYTLKSALDRPYPKAEKIIADAIGKEASEIWAAREAERNFKPSLKA